MVRTIYSMEEILEIEATMTMKSRKPKDMNAPKRPQSGFMLWANQRRPELIQANPGMTVGAIGKALGAEWKTIDSDTKASFTEKAGAAKAKYDTVLAKYKKTDEYHSHAKALLAWKIHETKKPFRKDENAPKRPLSAYMLYANSVREQVVKDHVDLPASGVMQQIGTMW